MFTAIRLKIKEKLETLSKIQVVYLTDRSSFDYGYPVAIVTPTENESDYGSTCADRMVFVFKVRLYYPITKADTQEADELALQGVVDDVLALFKNRGVLDPVCTWVEPAPSVWQYEERGEGVYRMAEVTLRCVKYV